MASASNMVGPVVLGLFMGFYLDKFFQTSPLFTILLLFFGLATGIWSILKYTHFSHIYTNPDAVDASDSESLPKKKKPTGKE